jgi:hypothetical protein
MTAYDVVGSIKYNCSHTSKHHSTTNTYSPVFESMDGFLEELVQRMSIENRLDTIRGKLL